MDRTFFLFLTRTSFGLWMVYVGLSKWLGGPTAFVGVIESEFSKTWSPAPLTRLLAWAILLAEPLLGAWLASGRARLSAWLSMAALMYLLVLGQTLLQSPIVTNNWLYALFCMACAALERGEQRTLARSKSDIH